MKFRTIDAVIILIFGLLCISRATWGVFKDIYIDISKAKSISGRVISAEITKLERNTIRIRQYYSAFVIRLENSNQIFAIDRGRAACDYLNSQIKISDTIKILYRSSSSKYNTFVFQLEKGTNILASYKDYRSGESEMIMLMYLFGFILLGGLGIWYAKKRRVAKQSL